MKIGPNQEVLFEGIKTVGITTEFVHFEGTPFEEILVNWNDEDSCYCSSEFLRTI